MGIVADVGASQQLDLNEVKEKVNIRRQASIGREHCQTQTLERGRAARVPLFVSLAGCLDQGCDIFFLVRAFFRHHRQPAPAEHHARIVAGSGTGTPVMR